MMRRFAALFACGTLLLQGCRAGHPVTAAAPPPPPAIAPVMVSVPPPTHHMQDEPEKAEVAATPTPAPEPPRRTPRPKRAATPPAATPAPPPLVAAAAPPPIELGNLSAGGDASAGLKQQTSNLLQDQNKRVAGLPGSVAAAHQTELLQAKTFLKRAADSWNAADYEGAHTLTVKAKVILDDMQR